MFDRSESVEEPVSVLVVDDDEDLADLYAEVLDTHDVTVTYDGEAALAELDESVDVVLLDRQMPGLEGDEVLQRVRDRDLDCRVALVSGTHPDLDVLELGFDDYLVKPVENAELERVVRHLHARSEYDGDVREYFAALRKREVLLQELDPGALAENEAFAGLEARIESLREDLDDQVAEFDVDDFEALFRGL